MDALVSAAHRYGIPVSVDVNYRRGLWPSPEAASAALSALTGGADYVFASDDELPLVTGRDDEAATSVLLKNGARAVVVSRGASGADVWTAAGLTRRAALPVTTVDTVGAGDALCAGFLSGVLDGLDAETALARGVHTAAFAVATTGDWEGLPTRADLDLLGYTDGATLR